MCNIPKDPIMLLSYINTQLRDFYKSLDDFCVSQNVNKDEIIEKLNGVGYEYNIEQNQFK